MYLSLPYVDTFTYEEEQDQEQQGGEGKEVGGAKREGKGKKK